MLTSNISFNSRLNQQQNAIQILNAKPAKQNYADQLAFQGRKGKTVNHTGHPINLAATVKLPGTSRTVRLLQGKHLAPKVKETIRTTAANAVKGRAWNIENPRAWMISAETATFMKVGGLAEVAVDLPSSFNRKEHGKNGREMPVVTPLYVGSKLDSGGLKPISLTQTEDNKYLYKAPEGNSIELKKAKTIDVPMYSPKTRKMKNEKADVLVGNYDGTKYIFLKNEKYFDVTPCEDNNPQQTGAYVKNTNNIDEAERMAFFSKAIFALMKSAKEEPIQDVAPPNVLVANDWHAGPVAGLTKYLAPAMASKGEMSKDTADYLKEIPIVNIVHNLEYQGWDYKNSGKLFNSLYGDYAKDIVVNAHPAKNAGRVHNSLFVHDTYNSVNPNMNLADVVVPVSDNYAEEIIKTDWLGKDFVPILKERKKHGTFLGITNGYTKADIVPSTTKIAKLNEAYKEYGVTGDNTFVSYDENYTNERAHNKEVFVKLLQNMADTKLEGIYKPEECDLSDLINDKKRLANTPILTTVGRAVEQKGFDTLAKSLVQTLKNTPDKKEKPIVVLLASGDPAFTTGIKDKVAKADPEAAKRIFVIGRNDRNLGAAIQTCGDMFMLPSKFEPCGLTQMEAMAKGQLPVAMSVGGLVTTISDSKDGFLSPVSYMGGTQLYRDKKYEGIIPKNNADAFSVALEKGLDAFYNKPEKFRQMSKAAMQKDFSWDAEGGALDRYTQIFQTGKLKQAA